LAADTINTPGRGAWHVLLDRAFLQNVTEEA
jgi:hypothetical protein